MKQIKVKITLSAYGRMTDHEGNDKKVRLSNIVEDYETLPVTDEQFDYLMAVEKMIPVYRKIYLECLREDMALMAQTLIAPRLEDIERRLLSANPAKAAAVDYFGPDGVGTKMSFIDGSVELLRDVIVYHADTVDMFVEDGIVYRTMTDGARSIVRCVDLNKKEVCSEAKYIERGAFKNCRRLETVKLPNLVHLAPEAFSGCSMLTTVELPDSLQTIDEEAFAYCYMLHTFRLPKDLNCIDPGAFLHCANLETLIYEGSYLHLGVDAPRQPRDVCSDAFAFTPFDYLSDNIIYKALLCMAKHGESELLEVDAAPIDERFREMEECIEAKAKKPNPDGKRSASRRKY